MGIISNKLLKDMMLKRTQKTLGKERHKKLNAVGWERNVIKKPKMGRHEMSKKEYARR